MFCSITNKLFPSIIPGLCVLLLRVKMELLLNKKTIAKMGSDINSAKGSKISNFAQRQMEKMGWKEGQGLGKNESGIAKHISVVKRDSNIGLGGDDLLPVGALQDNWWHDAFSSNLKNMKNKMKGKKSSRKDKEVTSEPPSYDDLFKATGGARLGMRARADQKGKIKRTELVKESVVLDTDATSTEDPSQDHSDKDVEDKQAKKKRKKTAQVSDDHSDKEEVKEKKKRKKST